MLFSVYQLSHQVCTNINSALDVLLGAAKAGVSSADPRAAVIKGYSLQVSPRRKEIMGKKQPWTAPLLTCVLLIS